MEKRLSGSLQRIKETFDWKWVFVGVIFIVGGNAIAYLLLHDFIRDLIFRQERELTGFLLSTAVSLTIYFLGGILVGRMSENVTVKEPAVAAVLGLLVVFVLQFFLGMFNIIGLIVGAPFCYCVAYLGGLLGEKWQALVSPPDQSSEETEQQ